jgi:hypothetical protein
VDTKTNSQSVVSNQAQPNLNEYPNLFEESSNPTLNLNEKNEKSEKSNNNGVARTLPQAIGEVTTFKDWLKLVLAIVPTFVLLIGGFVLLGWPNGTLGVMAATVYIWAWGGWESFLLGLVIVTGGGPIVYLGAVLSIVPGVIGIGLILFVIAAVMGLVLLLLAPLLPSASLVVAPTSMTPTNSSSQE